MIKGYNVKHFLWILPSIAWSIYHPTLMSVGVACFFTGTAIMQVLYGKLLDDARDVVKKTVEAAEESHNIAEKAINLSKVMMEQVKRSKAMSDVESLAEYEDELLRRKNLN